MINTEEKTGLEFMEVKTPVLKLTHTKWDYF